MEYPQVNASHSDNHFSRQASLYSILYHTHTHTHTPSLSLSSTLSFPVLLILQMFFSKNVLTLLSLALLALLSLAISSHAAPVVPTATSTNQTRLEPTETGYPRNSSAANGAARAAPRV